MIAWLVPNAIPLETAALFRVEVAVVRAIDA